MKEEDNKLYNKVVEDFGDLKKSVVHFNKKLIDSLESKSNEKKELIKKFNDDFKSFQESELTYFNKSLELCTDFYKKITEHLYENQIKIISEINSLSKKIIEESSLQRVGLNKLSERFATFEENQLVKYNEIQSNLTDLKNEISNLNFGWFTSITSTVAVTSLVGLGFVFFNWTSVFKKTAAYVLELQLDNRNLKDTLTTYLAPKPKAILSLSWNIYSYLLNFNVWDKTLR